MWIAYGTSSERGMMPGTEIGTMAAGMIDTTLPEMTEVIMQIMTIDIGDREDRRDQTMVDVTIMTIVTHMKQPASVVWTVIVQLLPVLRLAPFPPLHIHLVHLPRSTHQTVHSRLPRPLNLRRHLRLSPLLRMKPFPHLTLLFQSHFLYDGREPH